MSYDLITKYTAHNQTSAADSLGVFGYPRTIKYIAIHWWGNPVGQLFMMIIRWFCGGGAPTSAHYVAEALRVACLVSPENIAWHAGNARGNAESIGIECNPRASDADYATIAELIRDLRKVYGDIPLRRHSFWTSTTCCGVYDIKRLDKMARALPDAPDTPVAAPVTPAAVTIAPIAPITAKESDMTTLVSSYTNRAIDVPVGRYKTAPSDVRPGVYCYAVGPAVASNYNASFSLQFEGLGRADEVHARLSFQKYKDGKKDGAPSYSRYTDITGSGGSTVFDYTKNGSLEPGERVYVQLTASTKGVRLTTARADILLTDRK